LSENGPSRRLAEARLTNSPGGPMRCEGLSRYCGEGRSSGEVRGVSIASVCLAEVSLKSCYDNYVDVLSTYGRTVSEHPARPRASDPLGGACRRNEAS